MVVSREAEFGSVAVADGWRNPLRGLFATGQRRRTDSPPQTPEPPRATAEERRQFYAASAARAQAAIATKDWVELLALCSALAVEFPDQVLALIGKSTALWELGQPDPAEATLQEAMSWFPHDPLPAICHGMLALRREDWPQVLRRAEDLRRRFPHLPEGHLGVAEALRHLGRAAEAEPILAAARSRFRRTVWPSVSYARVAESRQRWRAAQRRWRRVRKRFPGQLEGYLGAAELQVRLGRLDAADRMLRETMPRFAGRRDAALQLAEAAQAWGRLAVAAELWLAIRARFPDEPAGYLRGAAALRQLGRTDEADAVLRAATERLPRCEAAWFAVIEVALARGDRAEARRRWRAMLKEYPAASQEGLPQRLELRRRVASTEPGWNAETLERAGTWLPGTVLSEEPVIILSTGEFFEVAEHVAPFYVGRPAYCFSGMLWTASRDPNYRRRFKESFERLSAQYPDFHVTVLANDVAELLAVRELGIPAELVNHNAFIDESIFDIQPVKQSFDAIYNARVAGYKRHELAAEIDRLKLIVTSANSDGLARLRALLPHCTIANEAEGSIVHLSSQEVAYHLNTATCGLCLSELEGAMFASAEYLLCGLPVVTTRNAGGRNWFFSNEYVIFADETSAAVAAAVAEIKRENVSRQLVRQSAREKIRRERLVFFNIVDRLLHQLGYGARRIEPEFDARFCDKVNYAGRRVAEFLVP